ncbi:MAG: outer membrane beta-barrel protein [Bacteroidales bacterium]|jgi:opacity protein-like surface antigen|nr:outer membrane beta-barrel protein [Bacteroidales bacterium]
MKKAVFILFLVFLAGKSYAQAGDLTIGAIGGYETKYKDILYGLNLSYSVNNPLQISLSGLMNPNILEKDDFDKKKDRKLKLYSTNLDVRFFLLNMETLAMGPSIGAQYLSVNYKDNTAIFSDYTAWGANIGWHIQVNPTDNLRINGGWRYSTATEGASYNLFYLGVGYAFNLF